MTWVIADLPEYRPLLIVGPVRANTSLADGIGWETFALATSVDSARNLVPRGALYDPTYAQHWPEVLEAWVVPNT